MAATPKATAPSPAGPSSSSASETCSPPGDVLNVFLRHPTKDELQCVRCSDSTPVFVFWDRFVVPLLGDRSPSPVGMRLICSGRTLDISTERSLADCGVHQLSTLELGGRLPSQGFSRMHQLLEHLVETLAPISSQAGSAPPSADEPLPLSAREPIMHAIDAEISEIRSQMRPCDPELPELSVPAPPCCCMSCTRRPNSTLWLCGVLLHSTDAAVVNLTYRVVQLLLRARADCAAPICFFNEQSGALTLGGEEARFGSGGGGEELYSLVQEALTPEGVAIASLLTLRQAYDAKTHPLLWQHPTKKQTLLELAARSYWPCLLESLLPALDLGRLASSGALSAVSMASYKAVMSMALNGRHELLSLLLQTGITSAQHVLLLLETVLQKKGKQPMIEPVAAEMVRYIGPLGTEACSVLKVAAGHSSAAVVALLLDLCHFDKRAFDLELVGVALAEACDANNLEAMQLLLSRWTGKCSASQAQPLLRAFAARGDAAVVARLLARGEDAMVTMDNKQRSTLAGSGLPHAAGDGEQRTKVLQQLLNAGAEPKSEDGETALRNAARDGLSKAMQLLLDVGTNVNAVDDEGKTVLCVAACSGCCETVRTLLQHGAQVRRRCPDGREPLDFAADDAVKQLLLVEVEKLRMGLLDELLADESDSSKTVKGGKKAGKKDKKNGTKATSVGSSAESARASVAGGASEAELMPSNNKSVGGDSVGCGEEGTGAKPLADESSGDKKGSKKKKNKKNGAASAAVAGSAAADGAAGGGDCGSRGGGAAAKNDLSHAIIRPGAEALAPRSPLKKAKGAKGPPSEGLPPPAAASLRANEEKQDEAEPEPSLVEAAVLLLSGQEAGRMRFSSLISALYDRSATAKEEIKIAGGAKQWLSEHSEAFELECDCNPGHESVKLRMPPDGLPPPRVPALAPSAAAVAPFTHNDDEAVASLKDMDLALGIRVSAVANGGSAAAGDLLHRSDIEDSSPLEPPLAPPSSGSFGGGFVDPSADALASLWSEPHGTGDDDLYGVAGEADPVQLEKKIRGVQKKLRRVQTIEEQATAGQALDAGQQALRSSKAELQITLQQLLQQWAVLEPVLIQQQAQRMLAIANSECAVCLDEYSPDNPAIRTSCCGYHFHKQCLQQCINSKNHCPICFCDKATCKVVEQRVHTNAHAG